MLGVELVDPTLNDVLNNFLGLAALQCLSAQDALFFFDHFPIHAVAIHRKRGWVRSRDVHGKVPGRRCPVGSGGAVQADQNPQLSDAVD